MLPEEIPNSPENKGHRDNHQESCQTPPVHIRHGPKRNFDAGQKPAREKTDPPSRQKTNLPHIDPHGQTKISIIELFEFSTAENTPEKSCR